MFVVESILERSAVIMGEKLESRWTEEEACMGSGTVVVAEEEPVLALQ